MTTHSSQNYLYNMSMSGKNRKDEELILLQQKNKFINEFAIKYQSLASTAKEKLSNVIHTANSLQEKMAPINKEIESLNEKKKGYEQCRNFLQQAKLYQNATDRLCMEINNSKITNIDVYFASLTRVKESLHFFGTYLPNEKNVLVLHQLLTEGNANVIKHFEERLKAATRPYSYDRLLSLVNNPETKDQVTFLDDNTLEDFHKIMHWLDGDSKTTDYMKLYTDCRGQMVLISLKQLKDSLQTGGAPNPAFTSSPMANRRGAQSKDFKNHKKPPLHRRISMKMDPSYISNERRMSKKDTLSLQPMLWDVSEQSEIDPDDLNKLMSAFIIMIEIEFSFIEKMNFKFATVNERQVFADRLVTSARNSILNDVSSFVKAVRTRMKQDPLSLLNLITVVHNLRLQQESMGKVLSICSPEMRSTLLSALYIDLLKQAFSCLEDFRDVVMMDARLGELPVPPDGTVHQVTSQAMKLIEDFHDFGDTAYEILGRGQIITTSVSDQPPLEKVSEKDKAKTLGGYMSRSLANLLRSIETRSESVDDKSLRFIFLLNNYHYVFRRLQQANMLKTMETFNCDTSKFFTENQKRWREAYIDYSFHRIVLIMQNQGDFATQSPPVRKHTHLKHGVETVKLTDKEKALIKEKFKSFNEEFLAVHKLHRSYLIPDNDLRDQMIKENKDFLLDKYRMFREKYENVPFSSKKHMYIRFSDLELEKLLEEFYVGDC